MTQPVRLPNFLVVGTAKSGTTSLHHYLGQHPAIYVPQRIKETFFFISPKSVMGTPIAGLPVETTDTLEAYRALFEPQDSVAHTAIGEVTPIYLLFHRHTIPNIQAHLDNPKILIVLRNPIDRAYSNHLHHVRDRIDSVDFEQALSDEDQRRSENWWYSYRIAEMGFYHDQVKAYMDHFSQVHVILFDDLKAQSAETLREIFQFLDVDPDFSPDTATRHNVTGVPRRQWLDALLNRPNHPIRTLAKSILQRVVRGETLTRLAARLRRSNLARPAMAPETRRMLIERYRDDIRKLETLIQRDLSHWLEDPQDT